MSIALADRIRAEELKEQIRVLVKEQAEIAARFASYDTNSEYVFQFAGRQQPTARLRLDTGAAFRQIMPRRAD